MQVQSRGDLRMLKAVVGIMGVLIVLGTAVVVGTIVHRLYANAPAPSMAAVPAPEAATGGMANPGVADASLEQGEHIAGIASAGGDVAIWLTGPKGDRLLLLDPASGQMREVLSAGK